MKEANVYTHARWRVTPGNEESFVRGWITLSDIFSSLDHPPLWGTLLRSATEPNVFYSFGPWRAEADVARMREDDAARAALDELLALCDDATPGMYHLIEHVEVTDG